MTTWNVHQIIVEDDDVEMARREIVFLQMQARGTKWPKAIGVVEIIVGFIICILGTFEVFIIPMFESKDGSSVILLDKINCYGAGWFAGLLMVLTGSTAVRATLSQRDTTVIRFFNLTILSLLVYASLTIVLIIAYSKGWTSPDKYQPDSRMKEVHFFVTAFSVLGLMFAVTGFVQYAEVICCGEVPLWSYWMSFLCPCIYKKVMKGYNSLRQTNNVLPERSERQNENHISNNSSNSSELINVTSFVDDSSVGNLNVNNDIEREDILVYAHVHH